MLALCGGLLIAPEGMAAEQEDPELVEICRKLSVAPTDGALRRRFSAKYVAEKRGDAKARLGVIACLLARVQGDKGGAAATQAYLRREHPYHPDLKYLSAKYTAALCTRCEGRGYQLDVTGARHRCVPCRELGWIASAPQRRSIVVTLLRRIAESKLDIEPRRQCSMVEVLNIANKQAQQFLASEDDEIRAAARRVAIEALAAYARSSQIALTATVEAVGVDGAGHGRIKISPFSLFADNGLNDDNLTLTPARWLRVAMKPAAAREIEVGSEIKIVATPHYFSGRIAGDDLHADEQLLMVIRPKGSVKLFGSFSAKRYRCRIGEQWFSDPF